VNDLADLSSSSLDPGVFFLSGSFVHHVAINILRGASGKKTRFAADRRKNGAMPASRRNRRALDATVAALRRSEELDGRDEALVGLARSSADLFDKAMGTGGERAYAVASLGRLHLASVLSLLGRYPSAGADAENPIEDLLASLRMMTGDADESGGARADGPRPAKNGPR
jgi:hypothetical protein